MEENPEAKVLVFVRTKVRAERVMKAMERAGITAMTIHGDKDQKDRSQVLRKFRNGEVNLLIATDVTARGIDIPDIEIVVNYDLPDVAENYVHRVGRTGRGSRKGNAYSFCAESEETLLNEIQGFLDKDIHVLEVDKFEYAEIIAKDRERAGDYKSLMQEISSFDKKEKKRKTQKGKKKKK